MMRWDDVLISERGGGMEEVEEMGVVIRCGLVYYLTCHKVSCVKSTARMNEWMYKLF